MDRILNHKHGWVSQTFILSAQHVHNYTYIDAQMQEKDVWSKSSLPTSITFGALLWATQATAQYKRNLSSNSFAQSAPWKKDYPIFLIFVIFRSFLNCRMTYKRNGTSSYTQVPTLACTVSTVVSFTETKLKCPFSNVVSLETRIQRNISHVMLPKRNLNGYLGFYLLFSDRMFPCLFLSQLNINIKTKIQKSSRLAILHWDLQIMGTLIVPSVILMFLILHIPNTTKH
jgi:hypothetical protein